MAFKKGSKEFNSIKRGRASGFENIDSLSLWARSGSNGGLSLFSSYTFTMSML